MLTSLKSKVVFLGIMGVFFSSMYASTPTEVKKEVRQEAASFPVYCDGVYAGEADSIQEAWDMCD